LLEPVSWYSGHIAVAYENLRVRDHLRKEKEELAQKIDQLTETLRGQEPLVTVGKFASSLSHELTNPLDAIRRFLNLALDQVAEDSLAREYLLKAKEGIRRAIQITSGLLALSRESARQPSRRAELHTLIEQSLAMISQNPSFRGVRFKKQFCEGPVFVRDSGLSIVFKNLFENACHAIEGEGTVITTTSRNGKYVLISILDTGCGVPEEHKGCLFEPFFTTKDKGKGTGIGLTICREIIERAGGEITFESADKQGTTFFITLPYQDPGENR
jgi:signal transduction histidine kinase